MKAKLSIFPLLLAVMLPLMVGIPAGYHLMRPDQTPDVAETTEVTYQE